MSNDGGPDEQAKLCERFAVVIAGSRNATEAMYCEESRCHAARAVLDFAQALTDEAMRRRKVGEGDVDDGRCPVKDYTGAVEKFDACRASIACAVERLGGQPVPPKEFPGAWHEFLIDELDALLDAKTSERTNTELQAGAEAMKDEPLYADNDDDASELHELRAENVKLKAKIAEFIDGEQRGEREPRPGDE